MLLTKSEKNLKEVKENYKKFKEAVDFLYDLGFMVIEIDIENKRHTIPSRWLTDNYNKTFEKLIEEQTSNE